MNDYELACDRLELAIKNCRAAEQGFHAAEAEVKAAMYNLERHEEHPGIPLPQYRRVDRFPNDAYDEAEV